MKTYFSKKSLRSERGASLVEYALLLSLIAFIAIGAVVYTGRLAGESLKTAAKHISGTGIDPPLVVNE